MSLGCLVEPTVGQTCPRLFLRHGPDLFPFCQWKQWWERKRNSMKLPTDWIMYASICWQRTSLSSLLNVNRTCRYVHSSLSWCVPVVHIGQCTYTKHNPSGEAAPLPASFSPWRFGRFWGKPEEKAHAATRTWVSDLLTCGFACTPNLKNVALCMPLNCRESCWRAWLQIVTSK